MTESWGELNSHGQGKTGLEWSIGRLEVKIPQMLGQSARWPVWFLASDKSAEICFALPDVPIRNTISFALPLLNSRFAFPTLRTERERWGTRHFWLFDVLCLLPAPSLCRPFGTGVFLSGLDRGKMQRSFVGSHALRARLRCLRMTTI